ncbi:hypothetical protein DIPPA_26818 [Diplonema papillatum]|nr:hypothetical protein DIPPA_26818 [Diplonema papillatum]
MTTTQDAGYDHNLVALLQKKVAQQDLEVQRLREEVKTCRPGNPGAGGAPRSPFSADVDLEAKYLAYAREQNIATGPSALFMRDPTPEVPSALVIPRSLLNVSPWPTTEAQLRDIFDQLDTDGNGFLNKGEFMRLYRTFENYGSEESEASIHERFSKMRSLGPTKLSYGEFSLLMLQVANR